MGHFNFCISTMRLLTLGIALLLAIALASGQHDRAHRGHLICSNGCKPTCTDGALPLCDDGTVPTGGVGQARGRGGRRRFVRAPRDSSEEDSSEENSSEEDSDEDSSEEESKEDNENSNDNGNGNGNNFDYDYNYDYDYDNDNDNDNDKDNDIDNDNDFDNDFDFDNDDRHDVQTTKCLSVLMEPDLSTGSAKTQVNPPAPMELPHSAPMATSQLQGQSVQATFLCSF